MEVLLAEEREERRDDGPEQVVAGEDRCGVDGVAADECRGQARVTGCKFFIGGPDSPLSAVHEAALEQKEDLEQARCGVSRFLGVPRSQNEARTGGR